MYKAKCIFFDFDGTLVDSERIYQHFWQVAASKLSYNLRKEDALQLRSADPSYGKKLLKNKYGLDFPFDQIREERKRLMNIYLKDYNYSLKKGAKEFLKYLKNLSIPAYIVTAGAKEPVKEVITKLNIKELIKDVISAKDVARGKPYPDPYLKAIEISQYKKEDILVIEDAPNGIESAFAAGLKVIMVDDLAKATSLEKERIILEVDNLTFFHHYLKFE